MSLPRPAGPPAPEGLYDPRFEHDACGVNFVVHMKGLRSHEIVQHGIGALCNLDHRGAAGAEPNTGDGAGILLQVPDRFFRDVVDFPLPAGGPLRHGHRLPPERPGEGRRGGARHREDRRQRGPAGARLARRPLRRLDDRLDGQGRRAPVPPAVPGRRRPRRRLPRAPGLHRAQAHRARARQPHRRRRLLPVAVVSHLRLQGHAHHRPAAAVLPRPQRQPGRVGAGAGALPLLHQHLPVVAAGAPVPVRRPQRRDQHGPGQPQLDAGPRGPAALEPAPGRARPHLPDLQPGRLRLGHLRRGPRAAAHGWLRAARTPC